MNKLICVSVLLVALCSTIKAELTDEQIDTCVKEFLQRADTLEVPERYQKVIEIVRSYEPSNPNVGDILDKHDIDTSKFYKDEDDLVELQYTAMKFADYLFQTLVDETCAESEKFQEHTHEIEQDSSNPNQWKVQKVTWLMRLTSLIQLIGEE